MRNDPRALRTSALVILALVPVMLLAMAGIGWAIMARSVARYGHASPQLLLPGLAILGVLPMMIYRGVSVLRAAGRHIVGADGHVCQCFACGRDCRPDGPPSPVPPGPSQVPSEQVNAGIGALLGAGGIGVVAIIMLVVGVLTHDIGAPIIGGSLLFAAVGVAGFGAWLLGRGRRAMAVGVDHGCRCRWCGAPGLPVESLR